METFEYTAHASRVIFGAGTLARLGDEVRRLGASRVLLLGDRAGRALSSLGPLTVAHFPDVAMHTPVEVTEQALSRTEGADCLVSVGGGSSTGLGKALAARTGLPQIAVPTTYAGSEMTPGAGRDRGRDEDHAA